MATNEERLVSGVTPPPAAQQAKSVEAARGNRSQADENRQNTDGTALTLEERKALLRNEWTADILPQINGEPGYHYCWLSTTNSSDPIYRRLQMGYELVPYDQMKQLGVQNVCQSGEFAGCVAVNEMLLARIHEELFQEIMLINHYERPLGEEELLKANAVLPDEDSNGAKIGQSFGDGINNLGRRTNRRPIF